MKELAAGEWREAAEQWLDLGSTGPGFDPRVVPKTESMFVNIYQYYVVSHVILCV